VRNDAERQSDVAICFMRPVGATPSAVHPRRLAWVTQTRAGTPGLHF
jgi:hypothetical protein